MTIDDLIPFPKDTSVVSKKIFQDCFTGTFLKEFPIEKILLYVPDIPDKDIKKYFSVKKVRYTVKIGQEKYVLFKHNRKCVSCGLEGTRVFLETQNNSYTPSKTAYFGFYAEENDKLVLMTKDHIKPKSYGGIDSLSNYQTLCSVCNQLKSSYPIGLETLSKVRKIFNEKSGEIQYSDIKSLIVPEYQYLNGQ